MYVQKNVCRQKKFVSFKIWFSKNFQCETLKNFWCKQRGCLISALQSIFGCNLFCFLFKWIDLSILENKVWPYSGHFWALKLPKNGHFVCWNCVQRFMVPPISTKNAWIQMYGSTSYEYNDVLVVKKWKRTILGHIWKKINLRCPFFEVP